MGGHDRYGPDCNAFHEAGYDAYITGCEFAHLAKQALCPDLLPALNGRCTMWKSLYNFNLSGDDELVTKGIHVHARGLKGHDVKFVQDAFAEASEISEGLKGTNVEIRWIDDDSAFVILPEACKEGLTAMLQNPKFSGGDAGNGGLKLTCWSDWLSAQTVEASAMADDVKEPELKRARTSAL